MAKILLIPATGSERMRWEVERRAAELGRLFRATRVASHLEIEHEPSAAPGAAATAIRQHMPEIVHYVGRGEGGGESALSDSGGPFDPDLVAEAFRRSGGAVRCVVLDGCWSSPLGASISRFVDCVVAITSAVDDEASMAFSGGFYRALGFGLAVARAFDLGENQVQQRRTAVPGALKLLFRPGVDPAMVQLSPSGGALAPMPPNHAPPRPPPAAPQPLPVPPSSVRSAVSIGAPLPLPPPPSSSGIGPPPSSGPPSRAFGISRPCPDPAAVVPDVMPQAVEHVRSVHTPMPWREIAVVPYAAAVRKPLDPGTILGAARSAQPLRRGGQWASHPFFPWLDLGPRPDAGTEGVLWRFSGSRGYDGMFALGFDCSFVQRELVREVTHPHASHGPGLGLFASLEAVAGALMFARSLATHFPEFGRAWIVVRAGPFERVRLVFDFEDGRSHPLNGRGDLVSRAPVVGAGGHFNPGLTSADVASFCVALGMDLASCFGWQWADQEVEAELRARIAAAMA